MSFAAGLTATRTGIDLIRNALDLVKREDIDRNEVLARLLELQGLILDARTALSDGQEEVLALRRTLQDNADLRKLESDMDFQQDGGFYIRKSEVAAGNPVPYCPICWGDSQKAIALSAQADVCYRCILHPTAVYETKVYREEKERNKPKEYVRRFAR